MENKFSQLIALLRKFIFENQPYVWLIVFTLFFAVLTHLNRDFLNTETDIEELKRESISWQKLSQEDLLKNIDQDRAFSRTLGLTFFSAILLFFLGIYLSLRFFKQLAQGKVVFFSKEVAPVNWTMSDVFRAVIIIFFFINLLAVVEFVFLHILGGSVFSLVSRLLFKSFMVDIFAAGTVLYFAAGKYAASFRVLGLNLDEAYRNVLYGISHYIGLSPYLTVVILFSLFLANLFRYEPQPVAVFAIFFQPQSKPLLILLTIFIVLIGPVVEEIFFRGFCYPALRKKTGPLKAALGVSLIFAWLHMNIIGFLPIFLLGLLLVYLYEKTNSLVASMTVHIIHNSAILYLVFLYRYLVLR
jgi:membrane protease YdiL (CAAX protease family)